MPVITSCPDCQRTLRVPDNLLNKKVRCPECKREFTAAAADGGGVETREDYEAGYTGRRRGEYTDEEPARLPRSRRAADEEYDEEYDDRRPARGPSPRAARRGWLRTRTGLSLNIVAVWVWLVGILILVFGVVIGVIVGVTSQFGSAGNERSGVALAGAVIILVGVCAVLYGLCALAETILRLTGYGMCMAVPSVRGTGLKPLAIVAFCLGCAAAVFSFTGLLMGFAERAAPGAGAFGGNPTPLPAQVMVSNVPGFIATLLQLGAFFVFLVFCRQVALQARERALAGSVLAVMIAFAAWYGILVLGCGVAVAAGVSILGGLRSGVSQQSAATSAGALALGLGVVALLMGIAYVALTIWYAAVLARVRDAAGRAR
jgi:hypothetical protein